VLPEHRDEWVLMTPVEIVARIDKLAGDNPVLVTLSGGNPALQPLAPLIELGHAKGHTFALETQGSVRSSWFTALDWLILSPKPPSSHMATDWDVLDACVSAGQQRPHCALKIVVFDDADYRYARTVSARYPALPIYLQVGNPAPLKHAGRTLPDDVEIDDLLGRFRWLIGKATADRWFAATVLPQLHVLAWGNKRGSLT
jgi:7-carboxy-7-deazaguanine synthase